MYCSTASFSRWKMCVAIAAEYGWIHNINVAKIIGE